MNDITLEELQETIEAASMGIWRIELYDGEQPRMKASSKMCELLGLQKDRHYTDEEIYDAWHSGICHDSLPSVECSVRRMLSGQRDENTYRWMHPKLGVRYVRCGGTAHLIEDKGNILIGYHYDVTDQMNELLKNIEENRSKTMMLQNMTHEIRTPLNAIFGFSQLLSLPDGNISENEKAEYFNYIYNSFNMMSMLIDDVLDMADVEHGNFRIVNEPVIVNEICRNSIQMAEMRKRPNVKMYLTTDVKDDYIIDSDGKRIMQILINFLTNACKHTDDGEIELCVSTTETPGRLTFAVRDTGVGIPADMVDTIFNRYQKANDKVQGSGLGLNICTVIADKLGGEVKLDKSYTNGARFLLIL